MRNKILIASAMIFSFLAALSACSRSAELADHFSQMEAIAKGAPCDGMGPALNAYLDQHEPQMREDLRAQGRGDLKESRRIFEAGESLYKLSAHCHSVEMENFRQRLSDIVLKEAL